MNGAEEIFVMTCAIIGGLLISSLITYWCRLLYAHMRKIGYLNKNNSEVFYIFTFFGMYIPGINILYLLIMLMIYEIENLERI